MEKAALEPERAVLVANREFCPYCGEMVTAHSEGIIQCPVCQAEFCGICFLPDFSGNGGTVICRVCAAKLKLPVFPSIYVECVKCGSPTRYKRDSDPEERDHFVGGLQFCPECYVFMFGFVHRGEEGLSYTAYKLTCNCYDCRQTAFYALYPSA